MNICRKKKQLKFVLFKACLAVDLTGRERNVLFDVLVLPLWRSPCRGRATDVCVCMCTHTLKGNLVWLWAEWLFTLRPRAVCARWQTEHSCPNSLSVPLQVHWAERPCATDAGWWNTAGAYGKAPWSRQPARPSSLLLRLLCYQKRQSYCLHLSGQYTHSG